MNYNYKMIALIQLLVVVQSLSWVQLFVIP